MKTKIYKITGAPADDIILAEAGEIIRRGGLVAFPTETVYGLGGDALNSASAERIYEAKGRPADNPLIIHLCQIDDIEKIAIEIPDVFYKLADKFWPGPLTMILKKSAHVPDSTTGGLKTVAVRMPDNKIALRLIKLAGGYIAAPSANLSGRPSPTVSKYVIEDMDGRIDMILDGGDAEIGLESTILDLTSSYPEILRPGAVTEADLDLIITRADKDISMNTVFPIVNIVEIENQDSDKSPRAPGMKYRHYAPKGQMTIIMGEEKAIISYINKRVKEAQKNNLITGVIASNQTYKHYNAENVKCIGDRLNDEDIARNLYRILREFDDEIADVIYSEAFESEGMGQAIMNRLLKAASYQIINLGKD